MMSKIYKNKTIYIESLADAPAFTHDVSGNPYNTRMANGVNTIKNAFSIVKRDSFTHDLTASTKTITRYHNLGYKPIIIGTYTMTGATVTVGTPFPKVITGVIPEFRYPEYGPATNYEIYVADIDNMKYKIYAFIDTTSAVMDFNMILLKQNA